MASEQEVARLVARVGVEGAEQVQKSLSGLGNSISDVGKIAVGNILANSFQQVSSAVTGALGDVVHAAAEAQQVEAQLDAVLKSTAGTAGVMKEQVLGLADSLSQLTAFDDEAIVSGESMLLTFTNIGKDVFPDATKTMLDMSQALGQDLKSSAIQLGKALQDPVDGVTALRRVGVNFTDEQQKMIKTLVASGKTVEAQKFILKELQTEFGGSAEAAGKTFAGQMKILDTEIGNIKEDLGKELLPVILDLVKEAKPLLGVVKDLIHGFGNLPGPVKGVIAGLGGLAAVGAPLAGIIGPLIGLIGGLGPVLGAVAALLTGPVGLAIAAIVAALVLLYAAWENNFLGIRDIVAGVIDFVSNLISGFVEGITSGDWSKFGETLKSAWEGYWKFIGDVVGGALGFIGGLIQSHLDFIRSNWEAAWNGVSGVLSGVFDFIRGMIEQQIAMWQIGIQTIQNIIQAGFQLIQTIFQTFFSLITTTVQNGLNLIQAIWQASWNLITSIFQTAITTFQILWGGFISFMQNAWQTAWNTIISIIQNAWATITGVVSGIVDSIRNVFAIDWGAIGRGIVDGIANGIRSGIGAIADAARGAAQAALNAAKNALGIRSPSLVFQNEVGAMMSAGIAEGFTSGLGDLRATMGTLLPSNLSGGMTPALAAVPSSGSTTNMNITIQNPVAEPASQTIPRELRKLSYLGVLA